MDQLSLESNTEQSSDAVDPSTDTHTAVIQGLNATLAQFAEASETQTAMLASLKAILLRADSDEEVENPNRANATQWILTASLQMCSTRVTCVRTGRRNLPQAPT